MILDPCIHYSGTWMEDVRKLLHSIRAGCSSMQMHNVSDMSLIAACAQVCQQASYAFSLDTLCDAGPTTPCDASLQRLNYSMGMPGKAVLCGIWCWLHQIAMGVAQRAISQCCAMWECAMLSPPDCVGLRQPAQGSALRCSTQKSNSLDF